jgi:deazaflavin-dependent oxidoreductase (nitroreductase family)
MTTGQRIKRSLMIVVWRIVNPLNRQLAGVAPWWVVIETTGRRSGRPRRTPLARGPFEGHTTWLIAVHGRHASWVKNVEQSPAVRLRVGRRWRSGTAAVVPYDGELLRRFNLYARSSVVAAGIDPALVRVDLDG